MSEASKKILMWPIFLGIIAVLLIGVSFAWYMITLNSSKVNILRADTLSLELDESAGEGISLDNAIPVRDNVGLETTAYTFKLKNNGTTPSNYTIYLDDLDLDTNQTRMQDKFIKYSLTKDGGVATTALLPTIGTNPNRVLESGTIGADTTIIYTLRLWIDSDATNEVMGTTFKGQLRIEAIQSSTPATTSICKRATTLHTEECTQTSTSAYCSGAGYTATGSKGTTTITYGNLGTSGTLTSGDAFDCDVNGDGTYDPTTERFYYVSSKDGDDTSDYATLIYYNNVALGVPSNTTTFAYNTDSSTYLGPQTAMLQLPTTTQWKTTLSSTTRNIKDETGVTKITGFDYSGYAARLLTVQEVNKACGITIGSYITGELDSCPYLIENTKYSNSSLAYGYWLESVPSSDSVRAWRVVGNLRNGEFVRVNYDSNYGVRPAIEVLKTNIAY